MNVEMLRLTDLVILHYARDMEEPTDREIKARLVQEHEPAEVGW